MKNEDSEDGFTLVTRKTRSGKHQKSTSIPFEFLAGKDCTNRTYETSLPKEVIVKQITKATKEIQSSKFFSCAVKTIEKALENIGQSSIQEILCYGLGRFSTCLTARYQLGFLIALKDKYQCSVLAYDPLFCRLEKQLIPELNCELITENEEGKRKLNPEICTLVFAPHCPKQLTNNFLWANWDSDIKNCIVLGNSFLKVIFNPTCLIQSAEYILKISPYTTEYELVNSFRFKDIFNDLAFHIFNIDSVNGEFWNINSLPPVYPENDTGVLIKGQFN